MTGLLKEAYHLRWTLLSAVLFGWLLAPSGHSVSDYLWSVYDRHNPVVRYTGEIINRQGDQVTVHIWGRKLRDCEAVPGSVNSYSIKDGVSYGAHEQRLTGDPSSRPIGLVDLGTWLVWPLEAGSTEIRMTVKHLCSGRLLTTEIVRVALK